MNTVDMNTEPENNADATAQQQARKPRTRITHERSRFVHATNRYRRELGAEFDAPDLLRVAEMSDDEYIAVSQGVITAIAGVLGGVAQPAPSPDVDAMMSTFADWQAAHPPYYHRSPEAMAAIRKKLVELGPGTELIPLYALSVGAKLPRTGRLILINNSGEETRS